jgi:hypothetical protein
MYLLAFIFGIFRRRENFHTSGCAVLRTFDTFIRCDQTHELYFGSASFLQKSMAAHALPPVGKHRIQYKTSVESMFSGNLQ